MVVVLTLIHYGLLLIFGVLLSILFAGGEISGKNLKMVLLFILYMLLAELISWITIGQRGTEKLYPLIIHIPLMIFIFRYFKRSKLIAITSVLFAYLCCQIPQWFATVALYLTDSQIAYSIVNSLAFFPVFYLLKRFAVSAVSQLLSISSKSITIFGVLPLFYYLFDYGTTVYTDLLYQGGKTIVLFMPSLVPTVFFVFMIIHYNEIERRSKVESENMLMSVQINQAEKDLKVFLASQEQAAIYRHDMRHHLTLIAGYLVEGEPTKAMGYINSVQTSIKEITPIRYCENNTVNLIFSHFANKASNFQIAFTVNANIPQNIPITETDLCALLSNGLENAVNACLKVTDERIRSIYINCRVHKEKLLILIENSYTGQVAEEHGLPKSDQPGHGFGVKSMVMIINKYKGYYSYSAEDGIFTSRIILPLRSVISQEAI